MAVKFVIGADTFGDLEMLEEADALTLCEVLREFALERPEEAILARAIREEFMVLIRSAPESAEDQIVIHPRWTTARAETVRRAILLRRARHHDVSDELERLEKALTVPADRENEDANRRSYRVAGGDDPTS